MWSTFPFILLVAYLPGMVIYRLPCGRRDIRVALPAEERIFWYVILSLVLTSVTGFALAAAGWYRFDRLLWLNGGVAAGLVCAFRGRLRLGPTSPRPGWTSIVALAILAVTAFATLRTPPAEYVIGGKDPGTYFVQGIQIAQRGTLGIHDTLIESIPEHLISLFARETDRLETAYGSRFMGFYLIDPADGEVMGQFPHLFPVWIAVGYGIHGLTGARYVVTLLSALGVLSVYFAGAWLFGRSAGAAGALLLALNVAQVWFSRYPNAETLLQVLVFAGVLAYSRASADKDWSFAILAALLVTLSGLTHLTGFFVIGIALVTALLSPFARQRVPLVFLVPTAAGGSLVALYYATVLTPYIERYLLVIGRFPNLIPWTLGAVSTLLALLLVSRTRVADLVHRWLPWVVAGGILMLAGYAYFLRVPAGRLAPHDAAALRTFTQFYLSPLGLGMALVGMVFVARRRFWPGLIFVLMLVGFSVVFFYKIRIVPEHFWAARRYLAVILPGACLLIGAAAFPRIPANLVPGLDRRIPRFAIAAVGVLLVMVVGTGYLRASARIMRHVEYAGVVPRLEAINALVTDSDLVLVEAREASDMHTLALPLAYVYTRPVLVMQYADPDKVALKEFLSWSRGRYRRVLFVGGSGSVLPARSMTTRPLQLDRFEVPEYESAYDAFPTEVRQKAFEFGVYELLPRASTATEFDLDLGAQDDLYVQQFFAKETMAGTDVTFRWSTNVSSVLVPAVDSETRSLNLWLNVGSRPPSATPAVVVVFLNDTYLGMASPTSVFQPYQFEIPPELASEIGAGEDAALLRLHSTTWSPGTTLGSDDTRDLGVMVDRVSLE